MANWYYTVVTDSSKVPDCIAYFETELNTARMNELSLKGLSLEKHAAMLPGIVEHRFTQLQEIEAILKHFEIEHRRAVNTRFKHYFEGNKGGHPVKLSSRDAEKYAEADPISVNAEIIVNEFALVRNKYLSLMKGLDSKNWMLGHIVKLRCAGMDDASI